MAAAIGSFLEAHLLVLKAQLGVSSSSEESTQNDMSLNQQLKCRQCLNSESGKNCKSWNGLDAPTATFVVLTSRGTDSFQFTSNIYRITG
jgi:hypothetical protein